MTKATSSPILISPHPAIMCPLAPGYFLLRSQLLTCVSYEFSKVMVHHEIASSLRSYSETSHGGGSRR
jgi:hypothetical protein